jgi:hypothetical protein
MGISGCLPPSCAYVNNRFLLQQPVTEGYQYSQLSPSRSPSGPTYTQLSAGARGGPYHTPTTAPGNAGKYSHCHVVCKYII